MYNIAAVILWAICTLLACTVSLTLMYNTRYVGQGHNEWGGRVVPIPAVPKQTYRVSDRVKNIDKFHLWLRRIQTITLLSQLQACCNVTLQDKDKDYDHHLPH